MRTLTLSCTLCASGLHAHAATPQTTLATAPQVQTPELAERVMQDIAHHANFNGAVVLMRDGEVADADFKRWPLFDAFDGKAFVDASNVHASARDWARWGDAFARGHVMAPERLKAGLREPMLDSGMDNRLNRLSWYCDAGQQRCHYSGAYNGFYARVYWDRARREAVFYISNSTLPPWRCARLTRDLVDALAGRAATPEPLPEPTSMTKKDLPRWAGNYDVPGLGRLVVSARDGRAFVQVGRGEVASLFPASNVVLYAPTLDLWLALSGPRKAPTLHLRSVFFTAEAQRVSARPGTP